jgi:RNA 3'-terminal phosphate cyclase (ATP)
LGERGKPAERVADEAIDALLEFIETKATVDQYLADQLLLPLSLASGTSEFITSKITEHLLTNAEIIHVFTSAIIEIDGKIGEAGVCRITPSPHLL